MADTDIQSRLQDLSVADSNLGNEAKEGLVWADLEVVLCTGERTGLIGRHQHNTR